MKSVSASFLISSVFLVSMIIDETGINTLVVINHIAVKQDSSERILVYTSGMTIDADGSPRAYHPVSDSGLDALVNAGHKENWWGIVTDKKGNPVIQGKDDPFPGFYISTTSLVNPSRKETDPARYVNSDSIPYIALPNNASIISLVKKGDIAMVQNLRNGKTSYAIFADVGPKDKIGEGSIRLANNLEINSNPRSGGQPDSVKYTIFYGSGNGRPLSVSEIDTLGARYFRAMKTK